MRKVTRFQTSDGMEHKTEKEARKYCEEKVGKIITGHTHALLRVLNPKYADMVNYIEGMLPSMAEASRWRAESLEELEEDE